MIDRDVGQGRTPARDQRRGRLFVAVAKRIPGVLRADRFARSRQGRPRQGHDRPALGPDVPARRAGGGGGHAHAGQLLVSRYPSPSTARRTTQDTHVPILFYGPPFKPGRYSGFTRTVDIAPTLAQVLGVTPAEPLDGGVLTAAIK